MSGDATNTQPKRGSMLGRNINPLSLYSDVSAVSPVHSRVIKEPVGRITSSISRTTRVARNATTLSQGTHHMDGDYSLPRYSSQSNVAATANNEREVVAKPREQVRSRSVQKWRKRDESSSYSSTQSHK